MTSRNVIYHTILRNNSKSIGEHNRHVLVKTILNQEFTNGDFLLDSHQYCKIYTSRTSCKST
uniref:Uncharacterized protein n=1 Tax=Arundo donax TaxID=35708 RepID=A0A0A8XXF8_ARUDO